jgi:hypothetical protein
MLWWRRRPSQHPSDTRTRQNTKALTPEERAALKAMAGALASFAAWLRRLCDGGE